MTKFFLLDVVDVDMRDNETNEIIGTQKYSVFKDEYGKYIEMCIEGNEKQKIYLNKKDLK
jgi:hypothetical protein